MFARPTAPIRLQKATFVDEAAAIDMVLGHLAPDVRQAQVERLRRESRTSLVRGLWTAYRGDDLLAAVLAQVQPGKTAMLSAPKLMPGESREATHDLWAGVLEHLAAEGVKIAQVLLETDHGASAELLTTLGLNHACDLLYLVSLESDFPESAPAGNLQFVAYQQEQPARFAQLVESTYVDSLDCPRIDGARDIDDVLEGYRAAGSFSPERWHIVRDAAHDVGCLLLADHPDDKQCEIVYLGVVPAARGRGLGVAIARHAQWLTRQAGRTRLVLAVDAANAPAIDAYAAAGFITWDRRSVFLRVLSG